MGAAQDAGGSWAREQVRLVYHYRDGHDFVTEPMLRSVAVAYMPLLNAVPLDAEHFEAPVGVIELRRD
jgi:hypothetical protein